MLDTFGSFGYRALSCSLGSSQLVSARLVWPRLAAPMHYFVAEPSSASATEGANGRLVVPYAIAGQSRLAIRSPDSHQSSLRLYPLVYLFSLLACSRLLAPLASFTWMTQAKCKSLALIAFVEAS